MKYLRVVSDLHLDFDINRYHKTRIHDPLERKEWGNMSLLWFPENMDDDKTQTTLVIPGDIWLERRFLTRKFPGTFTSWLGMISLQFKYVVFVLGNHDYWDQNLLYEAARVKVEIAKQQLENVFLLENDVVVLDQVKFVGANLWTDFNRHHPDIMMAAPSIFVHDYAQYGKGGIRYGRDYRPATPEMIYEAHMNSKKFIFQNVTRDHPDQIVAVVTHTAPHYNSIIEKYRTEHDYKTNFLYFTDLDERLKAEGKEIDYWFHGHMHSFIDYTLNDHLRVICNPRGYFGEGVKFQSKFRITLPNRYHED